MCIIKLTLLADWVVFDPFICSIEQILLKTRKEDLPLIIKLAFYRGDAYYLEHNIVSNAIRMRFASSLLKGKHLDYTLSGVIIDDKDEESSGSETCAEGEVENADVEQTSYD